MTPAAILALGFLLGMRHATDADHVVAVTTIVSRERSLRAAAPIGVLWGLGHTATILLVGGAIIVFGLVIPPRVGLGMELAVAVMLLILGALAVQSAVRRGPAGHAHGDGAVHAPPDRKSRTSMRPLVIGVVHGLAGSAAIALLVVGAINDTAWAVAYLAVFGVGTVVGMLLITTALAMPVVLASARYARAQRVLSFVTGAASIAFGAFLVYEIGFVHGLFTGHVQWTPA